MTEEVNKLVLESNFPKYAYIILEDYSLHGGKSFSVNQSSISERIYEEMEKKGWVITKKFETPPGREGPDYLMEVSYTPKGLEIIKKFAKENKGKKFPMIL